MIYPKKNRIIFWFVSRYVLWTAGRHFHEILFNRVDIDQSKSVLLIGNHFSFWDALILYYINDRLLKKKFHVMILEETSRKEPFLKYAGAFSVDRNSRDMLQSLTYAARLLDDPNNLVLIFPQGKLYSNFVEQVHFEKGILKIIKQSRGNFRLVFAATFVQYFKHKKPVASVYLKNETMNYADKNIDEVQSAYQQHYEVSKQLQTEISL